MQWSFPLWLNLSSCLCTTTRFRWSLVHLNLYALSLRSCPSSRWDSFASRLFICHSSFNSLYPSEFERVCMSLTCNPLIARSITSTLVANISSLSLYLWHSWIALSRVERHFASLCCFRIIIVEVWTSHWRSFSSIYSSSPDWTPLTIFLIVSLQHMYSHGLHANLASPCCDF